MAQERCEHPGASAGKGHEDGRIGASVTGGEAEGAGTVEPREESVLGDLIHTHKCFMGGSREDRLFSVVFGKRQWAQTGIKENSILL